MIGQRKASHPEAGTASWAPEGKECSGLWREKSVGPGVHVWGEQSGVQRPPAPLPVSYMASLILHQEP